MVPLTELLGESPAWVALRGTVNRLLRTASDGRRPPPVFIEGETGTGKTALAHALHRASARRDGPFVAVNSSAITDTLAEAQLFGHERGAFTDAREARPGLFQQAHTGTIFLDEIALMSVSLQPKLLKVLEDKQVRRVGGTRTELVDVWVIAASNEDIGLARRERRLREDLYQRLALFPLRVPPLREREGDIMLLAEHFLTRACRDHHLPLRRLDAQACRAILAYPWPGNVRELANVMERTALLSEESVITAEMLELRGLLADETEDGGRRGRSGSLEDEVASVERARIVNALEQTNWNITRAAEFLGISRNKLRYRIENQGLRRGAQTSRSKRAARATPASPSAVSSPVGALASSLRWERRRLTLLRVKVVSQRESGSPLDATRLLEHFVDKVQGFGGRVEELSPTTIVGVFGLEPGEDAPRRAALSAMAMLKTVGALRDEGDEEFRLRIAIHLDRLMVNRLGSVLQLEADGKREAWAILDAMTATDGTGTIVISRAAAMFLERRFELAPVGGPDKGPVKIYRLVGREHAGLGLRGRITRLVGRNAEMQLLRDRLDAVMAGQGQAVGIGGEPGIGKSHLLYEFHQSLADRDVTYLEGQCVSYATTIPYFPVLEILRSSFRVSDTDTSESVTDKVRRGLEVLGMPASEAAPYILHLLGIKEATDHLAALSPDAIKARTCDTLTELTVRSSRHRPLVLAVEDVHWIDTASQTYLAALLESLTGAPLLLLMTYRPGYRPPSADKSYFTQMALQPLSREDSLKVVQAVLETERIPDPIARVILTRAEGNPFFLEELARVVGEHGDAPPQAVPQTLEEVLLARIDRVPEDRKRLLQTASVLGREFPIRLLRELWDMNTDLDSQLRDLTRLELLFLRSTAQEPVHVFKHALVQEVAYESLQLSQRQTLHAVAARAIEGLYADRLEEVYDSLAHHYSRTENAEKAIEYLSLSAAKAVRASAHVEAVAALQEAQAHAERLADGGERERQCLGLILQRVHSLTFLGRFQETLDLLLGERERVERLGDAAITGPYYFWLGRTHSVVGDHERAIDGAQRALAEAKRCDDRATMGKAYYALAYEDYWSGQARAGVELGRLAVSLLDETAERFWLGLAHWVIAINHAHMGEYEAALEAAARVQAIGDAMGDPGLRCTAAWTRGMACAARGQHEAGIAACQLALESSPNPVNTALAMGFLGVSHLEKGDAARAIPLLEESSQQLGQFRVPTQGWFLALLGEAYRMAGQLDRAVEFAEQGVRICRDVRYQYGLSWALRVLGRIKMTRESLSEAETHLLEALDTFTSIEARAEAARTHVALAELGRVRSDHDGIVRHLTQALRLCTALAIPHYTERIEALAREWEVGPIST
jgi:DNA-binding NtrC family response regulator/tetratricopeptide (TPR) repeat protein/class 3 adenylate cyclase